MAVERVTWLKNDSAPTGGDRFWYRDTANGNTTFMLIDAPRATKAPAFDHAQMASALQAAGIRNAAAANLPITDLEFCRCEWDADRVCARRAVSLRHFCRVCLHQTAAAPRASADTGKRPARRRRERHGDGRQRRHEHESGRRCAAASGPR